MAEKIKYFAVLFVIVFLAALGTVIVTRITSCFKGEEKDPVYINQLTELEDYEYKDNFSSLCEFGYKTEYKKGRQNFVGTQSNYITDLMSAEGVTYTTKGILEKESEGLAFRIHFKGGAKISSIELDFKTSITNRYVWPSYENYSCVPDGEDRTDIGGLGNNKRDPYKWSEKPHIVYKFNDNNNYRNANSSTDVIMFKFCETGSFKTSVYYDITISNFKINFVS